MLFLVAAVLFGGSRGRAARQLSGASFCRLADRAADRTGGVPDLPLLSDCICSALDNGTKHAEEVSALHLRTIEALALAIEAKDDTTHDHLARVQVYAQELARELGLTAEEQEALQAASLCTTSASWLCRSTSFRSPAA